MQSDAELIEGCLNGRKRAFAVLVNRYEHSVRAVALNVLCDYHFARDASQDAFIKAYENLPALRKAEAFGPWLMKIARRCALELAQHRPKEASLEAADAMSIKNPNGQFDEDKRWLLAAIVALPAGERQVIMLRYFGGHSVKDVADIVGRSVGTVTKQLSRAHKRLRNILERSQNELQR